MYDNFITQCIYFRVDSITLLEEGFQVTSVDASDKMLKYALRARWNRRKEAAFDKWGNTYLKQTCLIDTLQFLRRYKDSLHLMRN